MICVILAAGRGVRLQSVLGGRSKALLQVAGRTLLDHSITKLARHGLRSFLVVTGYDHRSVIEELARIQEKIRNVNIKTVLNQDYLAKNNAFSLSLALDALKGQDEDLLIVNCDVIFENAIIANAFACQYETFLLVDDTKPLDAEDMKVKLDNLRVVRIGKNLDINEADGEYIGISRIGAGIVPALRGALGDVLKQNPNAYYEDAYALLLSDYCFLAVSTCGRKWAEIDVPGDIELAEGVVK